MSSVCGQQRPQNPACMYRWTLLLTLQLARCCRTMRGLVHGYTCVISKSWAVIYPFKLSSLAIPPYNLLESFNKDNGNFRLKFQLQNLLVSDWLSLEMSMLSQQLKKTKKPHSLAVVPQKARAFGSALSGSGGAHRTMPSTSGYNFSFILCAFCFNRI